MLKTTATIPKLAQKSWDQLARILDDLNNSTLHAHPDELIRMILESWYTEHLKVTYANFSHRTEDIQQLASFAAKFKDLDAFLSELTLMTNLEIEGGAADRNAADSSEVLRLTTVHQAKGLEFQAVFVIWLADGMFPSSKSLQTRANEEEERRLFYVSVTRAKDYLFLIYPLIRSNAGYYGDLFQKPSRFVSELPEKCFDKVEISENSWA